MPDRGVNAVEHDASSIEEVLTARVASRFVRALVADEEGRERAAMRGQNAVAGHGLFELAMAASEAAARTGATAEARTDAATVRALAAAARACGHELIGPEARELGPAPSDATAEARLAGAAALPLGAFLDEAIATTAELATRAGDDVALAWLARAAPRIDARAERVALGVIAALPERGSDAFTAGLVRARDAIAARRRAMAQARELRARRDGMIEEAAAAAAAGAARAIDDELLSTLRAIEETRVRELAAVARWHERERPMDAAAARTTRDRALALAEASRRSAIEAAHAERLGTIARHHELALAAITRATAAYEEATASLGDEAARRRARWEREVASFALIADPAIRQRMTEQGLARLQSDLDGVRARAASLEERARRERDEARARAEADEHEANAQAEARYRMLVATIEEAHARAARAADGAREHAAATLARAAAARAAAVEQAAERASRVAHERAAQRRAAEIDDAATIAAQRRAAVIDRELDGLDGASRG